MGIRTCIKFIKIRYQAWLIWRTHGSRHGYFEELLVFLGIVYSPTFEIVLCTFMFGHGLNAALENGIRSISEFACQAKAVIEALENNDKKEDKCDDHE